MTVSIDTIHLTLGEYEISPVNNLRIRDRSYKAVDGVFDDADDDREIYIYNNNGYYLSGVRAFINNPKHTLEIYPARKGEHKGKCTLRLSIPKQVHNNNYHGVEFSDIKNIMDVLERDLYENGITTDLSTADITRIDTFQNLEIDHSYTEYIKVFRSLQSIRDDCQVYDTTYTWGNKSWQISVYDKNAEMARHDIDHNKYPTTARFEYRILNRETVKRQLGTTRLCDLYDDHSRLLEARHKALEKLFSHDLGNNGKSLPDDFLSVADAFKKEYGDKWLPRLMEASFLGILEERLGTEESQKFINNEIVTGSRSSKSMKRKKIQDSNKDLRFLYETGESRKIIQSLYNELKEKVLRNG